MQQYSYGSQPSAATAASSAPRTDSDPSAYPAAMSSAMTQPAEDVLGPRSSQGSGRASRRPQTLQQQLSKIEKSVTHLLVATKQLLETLTQWSRGNATENEVSDVYVRLGYEFNIASRAFNEIGVDTADLGNVPELLRGILEETLSQEASQQSLDRYLPRIRDIIINLLHGLKKKQQRLRQRSGKDGITPPGPGGPANRQGSVGSNSGADDGRQFPNRPGSARSGSGDLANSDVPNLPPRTSSVVQGRQSPSRYESLPANPRVTRMMSASSREGATSTTPTTPAGDAANLPGTSPYPAEDTIPSGPVEMPAPNYLDFPPPPPPPSQQKQQDALAALQRSGELERRASRRFSSYQIQKALGGANGIPIIPPAQNTPIPNRGRDVRESMNAVRVRGNMANGRSKPGQRPGVEASPNRTAGANQSQGQDINGNVPNFEAPAEPDPDDSPTAKTPEDKLGRVIADSEFDLPVVSATLSSPLKDPAVITAGVDGRSTLARTQIPARSGSRKAKSPSPQPTGFTPEQSPQPGKELTLFLQYKSKIKKFVLQDGYNDLTRARLQLAFIEKFQWNTHNQGVDLPDIYIQDPISGVRHELEDLADIKDRAVLVLNVEPLDEVKRHIDDGIGGLRRLVEGIKTTVDEHQQALQRVSDRQQRAAKEIASIAAAPSLAPSRVSVLGAPGSALARAGANAGTASGSGSADAVAQLTEVQSLRRDLAVVRQTYTSFVADIEASMASVRTKAANVKAVSIKATVPTLEGDSGRAYVNAGKKTLNDDTERIVSRVDDLQDLVEDLRKDVVTRGVRPLPRQLETVAKDLSIATADLKKLQEYIKREKPIWSKVWEKELEVVMEDRDFLTMQEDLAADLDDDLDKAAQTFALVEQATKQQNLQTSPNSSTAGGPIGGGPGSLTSASARSASGRTIPALDVSGVDPRAAKDGVLGQVRALQPNHESRLEAIERAEKARQRELESRRGGEFAEELGTFVEEGKLKKSGGVQEVERLRKVKDEASRKEVWERQAARAKELAEKEAAAAAAAAAEKKEGEAAQDGAVDGKADGAEGGDAKGGGENPAA